MKNKILILIISLVLGFILAFQYQVVKNTSGETEISQKVNELKSELRNSTEEKEQLVADLNEIESKLKEYESAAAEESIYVKNLTEELEKFKIMSGYTDVSGPGVVITLDNPDTDNQFGEFNSNLIYNYEYILLILSNLNAAGAEAISINGHRHTNYTEIVPVGTHLNINGMSVIPPLEIKAIGNKQTLESVLNFKGGVIWEMKNLNFNIDIEVEDEIQIQRQLKTMDFKYAQPYE